METLENMPKYDDIKLEVEDTPRNREVSYISIINMALHLSVKRGEIEQVDEDRARNALFNWSEYARNYNEES